MKKQPLLVIMLIFAGTLCFSVSYAHASISFIQSTSTLNASATSTSKQFGSPVTAGNFIALILRIGALGRTLTVSDSSGDTFTQAVTQAQNTDGHQSYIYYAPNAVGGNTTATVAISGTAASVRFIMLEYSGLATSSVLDVASSSQGSGTVVTSGNVTTNFTSELLIGGATDPHGTGTMTATIGSPFTTREHPNCGTAECLSSEDAIVSAVTSTMAQFTKTSGNAWTGLIATFQAAPSGGGGGGGAAIKVLIKGIKLFIKGISVLFY